jgi:hypothetical protein
VSLHQNVNERLYLIHAIEQERGSRVLVYFLHDSAVIADDAILPLYDKLEALGWQQRLDVVLYSRGGFAEVSWKVISLLREYTDFLGVIIPYRAHSGATLIALAADEVVMGPVSELSATDPARGHYLLPKGPDGQSGKVSVEDLRRALEFINWRSEDAAGVLSVLFQQVHPLAVGALQQSSDLVELIARKALMTHWNPIEKADEIDRVVLTLNGGLHSPIYPVSRREARELGLPITDAEPRIWPRLWQLHNVYQQMLHTEWPVEGRPGAVQRYLCIIETAQRTTGLRQIFVREAGGERVLEARWETTVRD